MYLEIVLCHTHQSCTCCHEHESITLHIISFKTICDVSLVSDINNSFSFAIYSKTRDVFTNDRWAISISRKLPSFHFFSLFVLRVLSRSSFCWLNWHWRIIGKEIWLLYFCVLHDTCTVNNLINFILVLSIVNSLIDFNLFTVSPFSVFLLLF